ncbi:MAG: leucyl aminopeptidase family protein [Phycisphaeraceae bacterium]
MYRSIKLAPTSAPAADALVLLCPAGTKADAEGRCPEPDALAALLKQADTALKPEETRTLIHAKARPGRTLVVGLGDKKAVTADTLRRAAAAALRQLEPAKIRSAAIHAVDLPDELGAHAVGRALADGLTLANFNFNAYLGKAQRPDKRPNKPPSLKVVLDGKEARAGFNDGLKVAEGVDTARTLACTPPNVANPKYVANYCKNLAKKGTLKCTVLDARRAKELKMGGLLAVGAGGSTPPCMVVLEHAPPGTKKDKPLLLVGKGVTFDTGGYSLKSDGGKGMKYDKCGAMNVIGAMQAIANLKIKRRVVGIVGLAENMIDREAYRVDDILTISNGVTVEITNTDAEGRLVLADCLAYGTKTYDPAAVVDFATLTGGVVVALGKKIAGVWATDDALLSKLAAAGEAVGEPVWRLPLNDAYRQMMQAKHADLHNSAPVREAHATQGAAFLSYFVGKDAPRQIPTTPWVHVDIAGTSNTDGDVLMEKGPTGFGVRLATELAATL